MYPGYDGFLGTRASLMLDVVFLAMFALLPVLAVSIWLVRSHRRFVWHKRIQLALASILGITVLVFEIDIRWHGWRERAMESPYYPQPVGLSLAVHLVFAVSTALVWAWVVGRALARFPVPPEPGPHSPSHKFWGWLAAIDLTLTSLTGWVFYYLAFVA